MTIGELAGRFGLAAHVLRHWEAMGLLAPAGRVSGQRRYGREQLVRVAVIQLGKEAGFSLEQMRELLLATSDRAARRELLLQHHAALERRIAQAQASKELVEHVLSCPADDVAQCPEFQREVASRIPDAAPTV